MIWFYQRESAKRREKGEFGLNHSDTKEIMSLQFQKHRANYSSLAANCASMQLQKSVNRYVGMCSRQHVTNDATGVTLISDMIWAFSETLHSQRMIMASYSCGDMGGILKISYSYFSTIIQKFQWSISECVSMVFWSQYRGDMHEQNFDGFYTYFGICTQDT